MDSIGRSLARCLAFFIFFIVIFVRSLYFPSLNYATESVRLICRKRPFLWCRWTLIMSFLVGLPRTNWSIAQELFAARSMLCCLLTCPTYPHLSPIIRYHLIRQGRFYRLTRLLIGMQVSIVLELTFLKFAYNYVLILIFLLDSFGFVGD